MSKLVKFLASESFKNPFLWFFHRDKKIDVFIFYVWKLKDKYRKSSVTCLSPDILSVGGKDFSCKHQVEIFVSAGGSGSSGVAWDY